MFLSAGHEKNVIYSKFVNNPFKLVYYKLFKKGQANRNIEYLKPLLRLGGEEGKGALMKVRVGCRQARVKLICDHHTFI